MSMANTPCMCNCLISRQWPSWRDSKSGAAPVWVGKGEGSSFTEAANDLYSTSQQRLNLGQISAILFSERLMKENKVGEVLELINRYREIRYLARLFSTREPPEEILLATPFLDFRQMHKNSCLLLCVQTVDLSTLW